jgi:hypothetical protein
MTRRQVLFVVFTMSIGGFALLAAIHDRLDRGGGFLVWMFLLMLTGITASFLGTVGVRSGFPFSRSYSRPVSTAVLVGVPFIYTAVASSVSYVLPTLLLQTFFDVSFPLLPVVVVTSTVAAIMTSCSWSTRSAVMRVLAIMGAYLFLPALIPLLGQLAVVSEGFPSSIHADAIRLLPFGYGVAALLCIFAYVFVVVRVSQLRHAGERIRRLKPAEKGSSAQPQAASIGTMLRALSTSVAPYRCPTDSPTAAAVWLHLQGRGFPIVFAGAVMSVVIPVLFAFAGNSSAPMATIYAVSGLLVPLLTAAGASTWNRGWGWGSKLSAFEGARPQSAFSAVSIDILVSVLSLIIAYALIAFALYLTLPIFSDIAAAQFLRETVVAWVNSSSYPMLIAYFFVFFGFIVTIVAAVLVLRLLSALYDKALWMTALGASAYALLVAAGIASGYLDQIVISFHFWAVAAVTLVCTIIACIASARSDVLRPSHFAIILSATACFFVLYFWVIAGPDLSSTPRVFLALHGTAAVLPLTLFTSAPWLYSQLRQNA